MEAAGLVLGVLPLLIEAVKAYSKVADGLHTFRHWSREVRSISIQSNVQNGIFLNECRLLLRLVVDEKIAEEMLNNEVHQRWCSQELDNKLNSMLKENLELCCSIMEEMRNIADDMSKELKKFDVLKEQKQKNEKFKSAAKRLRGAISITFDKPKYEKCIRELRDRNGDLSALRLQLAAFQLHKVHTVGTLVRHKTMPIRIQSIQNASRKLHEALCNAWCCDDSAHRGHYAKLCLDAEAETEVRLDLAISCFDSSLDNSSRVFQEPPIWLYVQSISVASDNNISTEPIQITDKYSQLSLPSSTSDSTSLKKKASEDPIPSSACRKSKKRRVHFVEITVDPCPSPITLIPNGQLNPPHTNLSQTSNMCNYLQRKYSTYKGTFTENCVGYLETPRLYKHMFFAKNNNAEERHHTTVHSIFEIMAHDPDDFLHPVNQIKLAHKAALALLQYNDTPWLPDRWRLSDMSYFGNRHDFDETSLKTLHFSSQISSPSQSNTAVMDGVECVDAEVSDEIQYGINNLPLFFLGIALLEIAHWKPLEKKMTVRDGNHPVFAARRLALGRAPLGPEYQKIAQKCLQCNFGFGTDLSKRGLQAAVYNDVVCELEGMIERLTI